MDILLTYLLVTYIIYVLDTNIGIYSMINRPAEVEKNQDYHSIA